MNNQSKRSKAFPLVIVLLSGVVSSNAYSSTTYNDPKVQAYIPGFSGGFSAGGGFVVVVPSSVLDQFCIDKGHSYSSGGSGMKFLTPQNPYGPYSVGWDDFFVHSYSAGEYIGLHMSQTGGNPVPVFESITCED